jgi:hypothetical protein
MSVRGYTGIGFKDEFWVVTDGGAMTTGPATGRPESTKRVKTVVAIALTMLLVIAGAAPASAHSPNALFKFSGHSVANAGWTTCPSFSDPGELCVDTGIFAGIVTTQTNGTTVKEPCIAVTQFLYTFDENGFFVFISETYGELCGDAIHFTSRDLTLISASGSIPLTICTPNADGTDVVCVPDGTATVDLTWTGFGPRFHFANNDKFQLGPATCLFHDTGIFRGATLSGTVTGLAVDALGTNTFAGISDQTSMSLSLGGPCSR